jgi:hypothetical protein
MRADATTNRQARLESIPAPMRDLVERRLKDWDLLPAEARTELLENEAALSYFTEVPAEKRTGPLPAMSPARREFLERGLRQWEAIPEAQRQKMLFRFEQVFMLTEEEKGRALKTLSNAERQQIEKTLRKFDKLPASQRAECVRSFEKFASLSLEERQQFLKNAERWKLMSPAERQGWRELVNTLALVPPSPARVPVPQPPPPVPQPSVRIKPGSTVAGTNG